MNILRQWLQRWIDIKTVEVTLVNKRLGAIIAYDKEKPEGMTINEYYQGMDKAIEEVEK